MRVAHITRRFNWEVWGGTESVVSHLCWELGREGVDCAIYTTSMMDRPGERIEQGIPVHRYSYTFPWFGLSKEAIAAMEKKGGSPLSSQLFFSLLREKSLDLLHTHVTLRLGGIVRTVARLRKIPYVVSLHGGHCTLPQDQVASMEAPFRGHWEWGKLFGLLLGSRRVLQDADAIICVGRDEQERIQERYPKKRVVYIPNGVDVGHFSSAEGRAFQERYGLLENKILLCVARIDSQKNQLLLCRAFSALAKKHREWRLVLVGPIAEERYLHAIQRYVKEQGLEERVLLLPGLNPDDPLLPSAYAAADLFVLPSHFEPFGIAILEAWAAKVPVVASRVGGIPGFVTEGKNVRLFADGDLEGLRREVEQVMGDATLAKSLAAEGWREVQRYDWAAVAAEHARLYQSLL